ncbi:hypothetical protein [Ahrensia kielensis]|uniref:17 kDa surface antigen n=1 Tax=Ahrensia kielensis TaxID=76980 RepID=A0ABU9T8V3_9HYPH|nr:hypothetical protein [Ahrensia kielensis]
MKKITATIAALAMAGAVATGCTDSDLRAGGAGAIVGTGAALIAGGNTEAVLLSAAAGAAAGVVIGRVAQGSSQCYYSNGRGGYYKARC